MDELKDSGDRGRGDRYIMNNQNELTQIHNEKRGLNP